MKISVSFLKSNYDKLETIKKINNTDCDYIHVDVMDNIFVNNYTEDLIPYLNSCKKPLDVHLMVQDPLEYILDYKNLKPEYLTIHLEIDKDISFLLNKIKSLGIKAGIALNPQTPIDKLKPYLKDIDLVLIMSVQPGLGGQKFMPSCLEKIKSLVELKEKNNYKYLINVDGGINDITVKDVKTAQVDMCVSGSFICQAEDFQKQINLLK